MNEIDLLQSSNINDVCRLCANIDDNMVSIYSDEGADHMLENKIKTHLPFINICENDVLPKKICYQCASTVLVWNELYELCSNANKKLKYVFEFSQYEDSNKDMETEPHDMETEPHDIETEPHVIETEPHIIETEPHIIETEPHIIETEPHIIETEPHVIETLSGSDDKRLIEKSVVFQEVIDDHLFNDEEKSLNQLDKNPGTSNVQNQEHKSPIIQEDEILSAPLKSKITNIFERDAVNDDDHDSNMYLNAAGIDDEMNGLMNCHQLDISTTVDCDVSLHIKQEYMGNVVEVPKVTSNNSDDHVGQHDRDNAFKDGDNMTAMTTGNDQHTGLISEVEDYHHFIKPSRHVVKFLKHDTIDDDDDVDVDVCDEDDGLPLNTNLNICRLYVNRSRRNNAMMENYEDDDDDDDPNPDDGDDHRPQDETMCQICATVFKNRYNLLRHFQKRHPEYKMYECDLCRISFPSIDEFKDHLEGQHSKIHTAQTVQDSRQVRFACDVCGNMYKNKASAMNHLLTHTAKKNMHCKHCDFSCYTKQQLGVHQTKHDKRFVCDICNKRFAQKSQLDVHINAVHYNQRPFVCVLCKKSFKTKGSHDAHMIVHTDTRNYACPYCDKKCRKRYDLTLHIRTHTGEKPFKCSVCGRGFVQMCDTRKHEMLHFKPGRRKSVSFFAQTHDMATVADDE